VLAPCQYNYDKALGPTVPATLVAQPGGVTEYRDERRLLAALRSSARPGLYFRVGFGKFILPGDVS
jgi:hypothetical protein